MSDLPAAFECEYVDIKMMRTTGVVNIVFEAPKEHKDVILAALGGLPPGDGSVRVAIARLFDAETT